MATKSKSIVLSLPATDCFELVKKLGNDRCFKENESNEEGIIWTAHNYTLETWITPISENKKEVEIIASSGALFDMFGHLDQHVKFFAVQLKNRKNEATNITTCPNCKIQVLPKSDGTCPNCHAIIPQKEKGSISKTIEPLKNSEASTPLESGSSSKGTRDLVWNRTFGLKCPDCGGAILDEDIICPHCGVNLDEPNAQDEVDKSITRDEIDDLRNYILKAQGIRRNDLNSKALIGIFIFGWLISDVLNCLGKSVFGGVCRLLLYLLISLTLISNTAGEPALQLSVQVGWLIYIAVYVGAWIYVNRTFSHYQLVARQRIAEIERQGEIGIDRVLEKGLLLYKIFQEKQTAVDVL